MIYRSLVVGLLLILYCQTAGCNRPVLAGADIDHAALVSFDQFKAATKDESKFWFLGTDKDYHYFMTEKGFYRMEAKFELPDFEIFIRNNEATERKPGDTSSQAYIDGDMIKHWTSRMEKGSGERKKDGG